MRFEQIKANEEIRASYQIPNADIAWLIGEVDRLRRENAELRSEWEARKDLHLAVIEERDDLRRENKELFEIRDNILYPRIKELENAAIVCDCHTWPTVREMHDYCVALEKKNAELWAKVDKLEQQLEDACN